ncbi:long-chain acyl-CoA synthetase [Anaerobacterium chartisolvens]|uniref:Long-chain acyl-CoA synthetase n=1 Tax=Anaerobacterium chartisolvens TaxID=1297424 RepID=A0A369B7W3_9FIRM|nr:AMP-binding protein [Anaerobacterium chartisolvens]RCX16627.1 long-chain acyl-CoA synthetase [Anaerobacterium chartisolvens]
MSLKELYTIRQIRDLKDMLAQSCRLFYDKSAFIIRDGKNKLGCISYGQFGSDVESFGTALMELEHGSPFIAILGENRYEWCVAYMSTVNGAGVAVPLDKELPENEIANLLNRCGASAIVFSGKHREQIKKLRGGVPGLKYCIDMDADREEDGIMSFAQLLTRGRELIRGGSDDFRRAEIDPRSMRILLYTSGTTDLAKGVMLSHENICTNIMSVCSTVRINSDDLALSILPIHHTYECTLGFLCLIYNGGAIFFNEGLKHIPKNLKEIKPSVLVTVPLLLENMHKKIWNQAQNSKLTKLKLKLAIFFTSVLYNTLRVDIRKNVFKAVHEGVGGRMRLIITGAAAIRPEVSKCFRNFGIHVLQGYGLTECAPLVAGNRDYDFVDGAAGLPIPGVEVRIVNPDEKGIGEIAVKGSNVMLGYYKNEEATKKVLRDGWFYTGDLGYIDNKGFVYISGRLKNVIVTKNGKNIFPEEVETYINRNPLVQDALVWGKYDKESGETLICAQILPNLEAIREKLKMISISREEIMKVLGDVVKNANREMPLYKHIREFTVREKEFVKTTTQKIKRYMENSVGGEMA